MKWEMIIGTVGVIIVIVMVVTFVGSYNREQNNLQTNVPAALNSGSASNTTNSSNSIQLTATTVAQHAAANDCWIIINGSVYAITNYLNAHPGGQAIIIPYCGQDATAAFATKGGRGQHSNAATQQLAAYRLGALDSNTTAQIINQTTTAAPSVAGGGDGND